MAANSSRRLHAWLDSARASLLPVPALGLAAAVALGVGLPRLDQAVDERLPPVVIRYLFNGGPEAARSVLEAVAGSLITVTSLTFSLTVLTLQLASSQFSPRLLRTFASDRFVHVTLGLFVATFTFALAVLREVRVADGQQPAFVPRLSVTFAFLLTLASVVVLVLFLAHLARELRVENMLDAVRGAAETTVGRLLDDPGRHDVGDLADRGGAGEGGTQGAGSLVPPAMAVPLAASRSGFITGIDSAALLEAAEGTGAVLLVDRCVGDFVVAGTPLALTWPVTPEGRLDVDRLGAALAKAVSTGRERTEAQDLSFGLRQLTDVATKAISPGINDPTTAVHALGNAASLLCQLAQGDLSEPTMVDEQGTMRVLLRRRGLAELLESALGPVRRYGADDPDVVAAVYALLRDVAWVTHRPVHHQAVTDQLDRLRMAVAAAGHQQAEQDQLDTLAGRVEDALAGRWLAVDPA